MQAVQPYPSSSKHFNHTLKENQFLAEVSDGRWYIVGAAHLTSRLAKPARLAAGGCWRGGANINEDKIRIASYHSRELHLFLVMNWTLLANSHFIWSNLLVICFLVFAMVCNHCYSHIAAILHCTCNLCPCVLVSVFFLFFFIFFLHFARWLWTNSVLFSNLCVLGILVCNLEEDVVACSGAAGDGHLRLARGGWPC
jgi:hypothetical protein